MQRDDRSAKTCVDCLGGTAKEGSEQQHYLTNHCQHSCVGLKSVQDLSSKKYEGESTVTKIPSGKQAQTVLPFGRKFGLSDDLLRMARKPCEKDVR
jgi:hypothetical protein